MPFCSNCGAQIKDGTRFCKECGSSVEDAPITQTVSTNNQGSSIAGQGDIRKSSLDEINKMISYFGKKQAQYDEYDNCVEQIAYYSNPSTVVKVEDDFKWNGPTGKPLIIIAIILMVIGLFGSSMNTNLNEVLDGRSSFESNSFAFWILVTVFVGGVILLIIGITRRKAYNSYYRSHYSILKTKQRVEKDRLLNQYKERYNQLTRELKTYYTDYGYCAVDAAYTNPKILREIREPIKIGRADTIKEAMNLLVQDAHNKEMELQASLTAQSARSAARGANVAAFFTAASFINDLRK